MNNVLAVIPARYSSQRFPGKPLAVIDGKPMVMWVYDAVKSSGLFSFVVVATDDNRIYSAVNERKGNVVMTSSDLNNGTERCASVVSLLEKKEMEFSHVVNIQGDEPLIKKAMIESVLQGFECDNADIVTLKKSVSSVNELNDPNVVKIVTKGNYALYFSRSAIPFNRNNGTQQLINQGQYFKHIGIYGYKTKVLKEIVRLQPSFLEQTENLEQLRWLENGYNIVVKQTQYDSIGVDTPEDLQHICGILHNNGR